MKTYLEQVLHKPVELTAYADMDRLPLVYRSSLQVWQMTVDGLSCLLIQPAEAMALPELRRCFRQAERYTAQRCALYLRHLTYYAKDVLLQEGIPFVWENHLLYLPFLGMLLNSQDDRRLSPCSRISFLTQKLLLQALYESWRGTTVSKAAELLQVSGMSITRCFDEIEVLELPILQVKSRARKLYADPDKCAMWQLIRPVLRTPLIRALDLSEAVTADLPLSGISALAAYSMLADDPTPTYAIAKADLKEHNAGAWQRISAGEKPVCTVHEVGYLLPFGAHNAVDPLSLTLLLTDEEKADPRVEQAVQRMLEEYVW